MTKTSTITLNPDQKELALKTIKDALFALATLKLEVAKDDFNNELGKTILSLLEHHIADIAKSTNIEIQSQADIDKRNAKLRAANMRVHELEKQLGEATQIETMTKAIRVLENKFRYWWKEYGFGHTSSFGVYGHAAEIMVSCHLFGHSSLFSKTPVSDRQARKDWLQYLVDAGFQLKGFDDQGGREVELLDCDENRRLIVSLLKTKFPSADIIETNNHGTRDGVFVLSDVKFLIRELPEISCLEDSED